MSRALGPILAAALAFAGAQARAGEPVPAPAVTELFSGETAHRRTRSGLPITITFQPGGKLHGVVRIGGIRDVGRWWTREGALCYQWRKLANARRSCVSVEREGDRVVVGSRWEGWDEIERWLARPSW